MFACVMHEVVHCKHSTFSFMQLLERTIWQIAVYKLEENSAL